MADYATESNIRDNKWDFTSWHCLIQYKLFFMEVNGLLHPTQFHNKCFHYDTWNRKFLEYNDRIGRIYGC